MPLHYKSDGSLDMRYSSSKAAVASSGGSYGGGSYGGGSYSRSSSSSSSGLHYMKDGTLDMRYSSSRSAAAQGGSSSYYSSPLYATPAPASQPLHYKKDGTLDMRYSSSRNASTAGYGSTHGTPSSSPFGYASTPSTAPASPFGYASTPPPVSPFGRSSQPLHYKKDGTLDMRYSSSQSAAAAAAPTRSTAYGSPIGDTSLFSYPRSSQGPASPFGSASQPLHYKKDGSLDMRYSSSRQAVAPPPAPTSQSDHHHKKDGTLDMRYKSSREIADRMNRLNIEPSSKSSSSRQSNDTSLSKKSSSSKRSSLGVPSNVPTTKAGRPDLRTKIGKQWVQMQAQSWTDAESLPLWIPRRKDGAPDLTTSVARNFFNAAKPPPPPRRDLYYKERLTNREFFKAVNIERRTIIDRVTIPTPMPETRTLRGVFEELSESSANRVTRSHDDDDQLAKMPNTVVEVDYATDLTINIDKSDTVLGTGSFGVVYKGKWKDQIVAVKKLHTSQLTKKDRRMFTKEALVLGVLGAHPNIVQLYGYSLNPLALVMEYVPMGSLSYLLHYCDDPIAEAKMTDGRIKLNLLMGITHGMMLLHACGVTHGDIKPQNVLVTKDFQAKIADFGLATFRAKTSSITSSHRMVSSSVKDEADDVEADPEAVVCGTAAYMAPELLESGHVADELTDVYSFGILINEVLQEEEPYYQHLRKFVGKGPYAAALAAQQGLRPVMDERKVTSELKELIERCWSRREENCRPRFDEIAEIFELCSGIPNSIV